MYGAVHTDNTMAIHSMIDDIEITLETGYENTFYPRGKWSYIRFILICDTYSASGQIAWFGSWEKPSYSLIILIPGFQCTFLVAQQCHAKQISLYLVLSLHALSVLLEVELERLHVVVEAEGGHGEEDVLAVDRLPLLSLTSEMDALILHLESRNPEYSEPRS